MPRHFLREHHLAPGGPAGNRRHAPRALLASPLGRAA